MTLNTNDLSKCLTNTKRRKATQTSGSSSQERILTVAAVFKLQTTFKKSNQSSSRSLRVTATAQQLFKDTSTSPCWFMHVNLTSVLMLCSPASMAP